MFALVLFTLVATSVATYVPHVHVLQSSEASLLHSHAQQIDESRIDRATAQELVARVAGGISTTTKNNRAVPLPTRDVITRPTLVLTIVVEGEYANVDPTQLLGTTVVNYQLADTKRSAVELEAIIAGAAEKTGGTVVTASTARRQNTQTTALVLETSSVDVVKARGTQKQLIQRLSTAMAGSKIVASTTLVVPLAASGSSVALDIGRTVDQRFLHELDLLLSQGPALSMHPVCEAGTTTNVIASLTTLSTLSASQRWDAPTTSLFATAVVQAIMNAWSNPACVEADKILFVVVSGVVSVESWSLVEGGRNATAALATGRRLLGEASAPAPAPAARPLPPGTRYYNQGEINQYQIKIGASVVFAIALLLSVCLFCGSTMNYKTDNMLFGQISFKNHRD